MQKFRFLLGCSVALLVLSVLSFAQTGSFSGTVTDASSAVVQGAEVTVRNTNTGITRTTTSNSTGGFTITDMPVGSYEITIKKQGFKAFHVPAIQLTVAQVLSINAKLETGAVSEEIQVNASQVQEVDTETSQVSNLVESKQILALPLILRDPYALVLLSPGTSQTNAIGGFTVNGSRERNNNFLLDGVDNNDTSVPGGGSGALAANPDSTEEFRVITNGFAAEFGRNTGAIVDVVTKSGTNQFHGDVYEFGRWNGFGGARDFFNVKENGPQDPYVRNQFGYSIGGPIIKNKTFFFFNQEFQRFRTTLTNSATVPTAAFKTGIFTYQGEPIDLTQGGTNNGTGNAFFGDPAGNAPPDPTMQNVFSLYPNPTIDNGDGLTGTLLFPSSSAQSSWAATGKIDHHFTDRETLSLRYNYNKFFDPNPFHADILPGDVGGINEKALAQGLSVALTSTLSNNLINNFSFGWNRIYANFGCTGLNVLDSVVPQLDQFGNGWDIGFGPFTSFGCLSLVSDNQWRKTGTASYGDSLSWVHGSHTFKFGGDFRNIGEQGPTGFFSRRQVGLTLLSTFGIPIVQNADDVDDFSLESAADAYYGIVANDFQAEFFDKGAIRQGTDNKHFRQHEYDWYGQDTWKIRPNLTLTLGLRYQMDGVPFEEGANFSNLLGDPTAGPVTMSIVGPGTGHDIYHPDYSNLEPRVGFSWDPWGDGKTAVRGAFGVFHDRVFGNLFGNARGNPPFEQDYQAFPADTINGFYGGALNGPFVLPSTPDTTPSLIIPDYDPNLGVGALAPVLFDPHFRNAASNNWNFGIQRDLPGNNVIDVAYVGSEGHHIYRELDANPPDPALVQDLLAYCVPTNPNNVEGCTSATVQKTNLYLGQQFGALPFNAVAHNALFQPFFQASVGNSIYNSLQVKFTHRQSHGLTAQVSYTWAHAIDDSNDPLVPAAGNRGFPRNSRILAEERGNSDNDIRHVAVINYTWEMPFGKGKAYANSGVVGKVLEGWQLAGITTVQTGHPFDVFTTTDMERTGLSGRADLVGDPYAAGPNNQNGLSPVWFTNTDAFSTRGSAAAGPNFIGPGSVGRNRLYGPGLVDFDAVLSKRIKFTERFNAELRFEGYNIFNHPQFINPGSDGASNNVTSPNFGLITGTITHADGTTSARQMQVALKLNF